MKSRIICLAPGRVAPGMALAAPVTGHDGQILLSAGVVLDAEMLERLIRRGIESVFVTILDTRDEETIAIEMNAIRTRLEFIFRGQGSPARAALQSTILNYRLEQAK